MSRGFLPLRERLGIVLILDDGLPELMEILPQAVEGVLQLHVSIRLLEPVQEKLPIRV